MSDPFHQDSIYLVKPDGTRLGPLKAGVQPKMTFLDADQADVEEGDVVIRLLPNDMEEYFEVIDRGYYPETGYQMKTKRLRRLEDASAFEGRAAEAKTAPADPRSVFVVHGRNERLRRSMFAFLRALGLSPIEWTKALELTGKASPYVGEVLEAAFSKAQAIVVLLTPDDEARLHPDFRRSEDEEYERRLTGQARPNVLFEAGMALGHAPDRTVLVECGKLRPFSDIAGRHMLRMNDSQHSRQALAQRLQTAGCAVDLSGTDWHDEGDFELAQQDAGQERAAPESPADGPRQAGPGISVEARKILEALDERDASGGAEGVTTGILVASLRIPYAKAQHYLDRLEEAGYVDEVGKIGGESEYYLSKPGRALLYGGS